MDGPQATSTISQDTLFVKHANFKKTPNITKKIFITYDFDLKIGKDSIFAVRIAI